MHQRSQTSQDVNLRIIGRKVDRAEAELPLTPACSEPEQHAGRIPQHTAILNSSAFIFEAFVRVWGRWGNGGGGCSGPPPSVAGGGGSILPDLCRLTAISWYLSPPIWQSNYGGNNGGGNGGGRAAPVSSLSTTTNCIDGPLEER